ncbi:hypothetical protein ACFQJD_11925 [Haloplanus sp. GCM10025708]|uniref:hypothetical protein n=1 Tax=Haloplanus sp. GCM10025708 TaxID=3252679 RepID=UPI00361A1D0C
MNAGLDVRTVAVAAVACLFVAVVVGLLLLRVVVPVVHRVVSVVRTVGGSSGPRARWGRRSC